MMGLGGAAVVVLDAAEDRQSDKLACLGRRLPQLWIRIRDTMQRLRRARSVIVTNVLRYNSADVVDAYEQEMVEHLFP